MNYLIVVDMQEDFVNGCLGSMEAKAIVKPMTEYVQNFDGRVIFTMDTHGEDYLKTFEGQQLPVAHCIKGSEGWKIVDELKPFAKNCVEKSTFASVDLAKFLKEENDRKSIEGIELVGVCTSICVISNAMVFKAFLPEVPIKVNANLCACIGRESHLRALDVMEVAQIEIER